MKPYIGAALLIGVVLVAGLRLMLFYTGQPEQGTPIPHLMPVACSACGQIYADKIGKQPARCRYCGEVAVWRAMKCHAEGCGAIFPLSQTESTRKESEMLRCPKCGSTRVGQVPADEITTP
ncbi:MAG: hypothetical protein KKB50_00620 [Planctomycetes bacterium]|nr:hypothetical protein [Planctomycetota bacterium]